MLDTDIREGKTRMSNQVFINIYNIIINKDMTISIPDLS